MRGASAGIKPQDPCPTGLQRTWPQSTLRLDHRDAAVLGRALRRDARGAGRSVHPRRQCAGRSRARPVRRQRDGRSRRAPARSAVRRDRTQPDLCIDGSRSDPRRCAAAESGDGMISAADLHAALAGDWPRMLARLGIDEKFLRNRHGPCPACGGTERFRFDNKQGRGRSYCNHCGAEDGVPLLMLVNGWPFREAAQAVEQALGYSRFTPIPASPQLARKPDEPAKPTGRVRDLLTSCAPLDLVPAAVAYLESRRLWPVSAPDLVAAPRAEYWHERKKIGVYPALVGRVRDRAGEIVTAHVTYLSGNGKLNLDGLPARKILSPMTGRQGCAIRLGDPSGG